MSHTEKVINDSKADMKTIKHMLTLLLALTSSIAFGGELQFVCNFGSEVKISGSDIAKPRVDIKQGRKKFGFYVDDRTGKAEYINFEFGVKSPLATAGSSASMLVLTELAGGDNHFTVTIFLKKAKDGSFPSVFSQHSWGEPSEHFRPSTMLGTCSGR